MRIAFFGTSDFAVPTLHALSSSIELAVSQPARPHGRGLKLTPSPVEQAARDLGLPVETPLRSRDASFVDQIRSGGFDVLLVAAYGQILSQSILDSTKFGAINLHASILPRHRGAAPIAYSILTGDETTGVTLMQMDRGMDTGDILAIETTPIGMDETAGELSARLARLAAKMAREWLPRILSGEVSRTAQDHNAATYAPKLTKEDGRIRLTESTLETYRRFRAMTPVPGSFLETAEGPVKVLQMRPCDRTGAPGHLVATSPQPVVALSSGSVELIEVQPPGKRPMGGRDWVNGRRLAPGEPVGILEEP